MQVSRTLRCFQGCQVIRSLQLYRLDDVLSSKCQHLQRHSQFGAPSLGCHRSFSSPSGQETEKFLKESAVSKAQIEDASSSTTNVSPKEDDRVPEPPQTVEDDFDITVLENKIGQPNTARNQRLLLDWMNEVDKAKHKNQQIEMVRQTEPKVLEAIQSALKDTASVPELRLKCLRLYLLGGTDDKLTKKLLDQTMQDAQFMTIKVIADIIHLLSISPKTKLRVQTRKDLISVSVNKRWFEIGPKQIVFFLYQLDEVFNMRDICLKSRRPDTAATGDGNDSGENPSQEVKNLTVDFINVEKRLISLIDELKPKDLARVVSLMGKWRNRNQVLLPALVHRLSLADMRDFTLIQLSNLLFACSILSLHNSTLFNKIAHQLLHRDFSSPAMVSSLLSSLSHLRWKNDVFVSKCLSYLSDHVDTMSSKDARSILLSLANLYVIPSSDAEISSVKAMGQKALETAKSEADVVDVVWSLAVLQQLDAHTASTVLQPGFVHALKDDQNFQSRNGLHKLRGVHLSARFELEGYDGPFMEEKVLHAESTQDGGSARSKLVSSLQNALGKFVDMDSYVRLSESPGCGLEADAVMCSGPDGTPKPLNNLDTDGEDHYLHRLCVQVVPFSGMLTSHGAPCGTHQMAARHLPYLGYTAVQLPYSSLRESQSVLEHVNAIQAVIKAAVKKS